MALSNTLVQFSGHQFLRHRLVLSILSGRPVRIDKIRSDEKNPGLAGQFQEDSFKDILTHFKRLRDQPPPFTRESHQWNDH